MPAMSTSAWVRFLRFWRVKPERLTSAEPAIPGEPGEAICRPNSRSRVRSTSISSTSMTTSGRALSIAAISRPAAAIRSGVSRIAS
jgi:hypothetical protein